MKRKIITLCGSTKFRDQFKEIERMLTMQGKIPLPPAFYGKAEGIEYLPEMAKQLWELHLDKINISDGIYVIDLGGYIGESTKKEIEFAKSAGKDVKYYSRDIGNKLSQI